MVSTQETELLDWCAGLRTVLPPGAPALARLTAHVGRGELTVALTRPAGTWWEHAAPAAGAAGVRFVALVAS